MSLPDGEGQRYDEPMGRMKSAELKAAMDRRRAWVSKMEEGGKYAEDRSESPAWTTATRSMLAVLSGIAEPEVLSYEADPQGSEEADKAANRAAEVRRWRMLARDRQATPERRGLARRHLRGLGELVEHDRGGLGTNPLPAGALLELHRRWRTLLVWLRRRTAEQARAKAKAKRMSENGTLVSERAAALATAKAKAGEVTVARLVEEARRVLGPWFPLYDVDYFQTPPHGSPIKVVDDGRRKLAVCYSVETARLLGHLAGKGDRKDWARDQVTAARKVIAEAKKLSYATRP